MDEFTAKTRERGDILKQKIAPLIDQIALLQINHEHHVSVGAISSKDQEVRNEEEEAHKKFLSNYLLQILEL